MKQNSKLALSVVTGTLALSSLFSGAAIVNLGSQSGNTITDEVVAYGWIRSDSVGTRHGGETAFVGTSGSTDFRGYVAYDLSGFSVGDIVTTATVSLYSEGANTFNANGSSTTDATSIGLNLTTLPEITGYGGGFGNNAALDIGGATSAATFANISGLYGSVVDTVTLNLDTIAPNAQVDFDVTAEIQAAINAGSSKLTFGFTSPDAIATGSRNFFGFEGMDQGGDGGSIGPNLNVDFTPVPEPSSSLIIALGGFLTLLRRRRS